MAVVMVLLITLTLLLELLIGEAAEAVGQTTQGLVSQVVQV